MPEISRFFGIIVAMFYNDHAPPHFHVRYGEQKAIIAIETLRLLEGKLKPRTLGLENACKIAIVGTRCNTEIRRKQSA